LQKSHTGNREENGGKFVILLAFGQSIELRGGTMNRTGEKLQILKKDIVEVGQYIKKYPCSSGLSFFAAAVFVCWPDVNPKKFGVDEYVVNLGKCFIVTAGIVKWADEARKIGV
jgi:hypothetical protein